MAADGLTNREVGRKPYLAHRTVAYHLYRILPEFGIAVRKRASGRLLRAGNRVAVTR
jgi:DNA-binding NarL/FixJ family response regulator